MKCIPMIFNQDMVSALVDGRKTVTRRPMKLETKDSDLHCLLKPNEVAGEVNNGNFQNSLYKPGDLIWVRETFCIGRIDELDAEHPADRELIIEQCTGDNNYITKSLAIQEGVTELCGVKWKPSIHMPRKASRLTLRVTGVRCERIQNITDDSAIKEGLATKEHRFSSMEYPLGNVGYMVSKNSSYIYSCPVAAYAELWNSIYSNWDENPWVWVVEFDVIHKNIDEIGDL